MLGIEFITCKHEGCGRSFRKGTGHLVACCCGAKPICNDCYIELKKAGFLKDTNFKKTEYSKNIIEGLK